MADALALYILKDEYNEDFEKVFHTLLKNGPTGVGELIKQTSLNYEQIKEILVIFILNNFVRYKSEIKSDKLEMDHNMLYEVSVDGVLNIVRFPVYLMHISQIFDRAKPMARLIMETFLAHAMLSNEECYREISQRLNERNQNTDKENFKASFEALIECNYLIQVESFDLMKTEAKEFFEKPAKRKGNQQIFKKESRKNKKLKPIFDSDDLILDSKMIFHSIAHVFNFTQGEEFMKQEGKEAASSKDIYMGDAASGSCVYRPNFKQILKDLRSNQIVDLIHFRFGDIKITNIVRKILESSRDTRKSSDNPYSDSFTLSELKEMIPSFKNIDEDSKGKGNLKKILESINSDSCQFITVINKKNMDEEAFTINIENIVKILQIKMIEKTLEAKFKDDSGNHAKIFRVLKKFKNIEDKKAKFPYPLNLNPYSSLKISEYSAIPLKDTREVLLSFLQERMISMKEFTGDKNQKIYVYTLNLEDIVEKIKNQMYKTLLNLKIQQKIEEEKYYKLELTSNETKDVLTSKKNRILKFESIIIEITKDLMIFTDY